jgi:addiction module HigA family antidote
MNHMGGITVLPWAPDIAIPPGGTLLDMIEFRDISRAELAKRTGIPGKTINEIIKGRAAIAPETALQFEKVLGVPASLWLGLERNYRTALTVGWRPLYPTLRERLAEWGKEIVAQCGDVLGMLLQRTGHPGHIAEMSVDDWGTDTHFSIRNNHRFTILSIGPRSYYFDRVTGQDAGTGYRFPERENRIVTQGHTDTPISISVPDSDGHAR